MHQPFRIERPKARTLPGTTLAFALSLLPLPSWAALDAFMYIVGEDQGAIQGDVIQAGREGSILVEGYGHNLSADYDPASGLPSGERQHRPVRVLKPVDKSSARLMNALINGENLTSVIIRFWRPASGGIEQQYYTVELTNARIVGITPTHSSTAEDAATPFYETVSFTFQTVTQTFELDASTAVDSWQATPP